ncbi:phenylalanine--tRNA ligase beta subunit-related protein [Bradyrhizobium sp. CB82]|uniref:B3/B4 domain-containing protein n=1 Tax=Bradyrhizobium sp. CB82 TaxID=3039159 RepID=UPI0024B2255B|nr:phenylalanine--tRNA ligase beta subunit-related protein [Bradyrhizobium sp. CB82]WFU44600.1 phenylalanine--tRNA ligase beta subunit-related protein [Bradyrhizobium sp. CB82]
MTRFDGFRAGLVLIDEFELTQLESAVPKIVLSAEQDVAEMASIKAWRDVYRQMGVNPTKTRNAAEALIRRFKKDGSLPMINPVVDACNHAAVVHGIPIAAVDISTMPLPLVVRQASGTEVFFDISGNESTLSGEEVTYLDDRGRAHARYWNHKQSGASAVSRTSKRVLITIEAIHGDAGETVRAATDDVIRLLKAHGVRLTDGNVHIWLYDGNSGSFDVLAGASKSEGVDRLQ